MWMTALELARLLKAPIGTIYRWAHEDHWPRTTGRPVYYSVRAAVASHAKRQCGDILAASANED